MGIVVIPTYSTDPATVNAANLDAKVSGLATEFNGSIDDANIKTGAAIGNAKLNLASISQNITHSGTMTHSGPVTMSGKDFTEAKCADIASATTTTIWATDGNFAHITGTTTITSFGTAGQAGDERTIVFDGILTLTHNSTSLILPTGANITTAAGDCAIVRAETTANARVISYTRKDGTPIAAGISAAAQSDQETATSTTTYVSPGRQQYHPGHPKAWCRFNGTTTGTNAPTCGYGVTSVARSATGDYTVNFTTPFSGTAAYAAKVNPMQSGAQVNQMATQPVYGTATFRFFINGAADSTKADCDNIVCEFYGDQ